MKMKENKIQSNVFLNHYLGKLLLVSSAYLDFKSASSKVT